MHVQPIADAIEGAEALVKIFKALEKLPDEESRARVMAIVATKFRHYDHALAFVQAAKRLAAIQAAKCLATENS